MVTGTPTKNVRTPVLAAMVFAGLCTATPSQEPTAEETLALVWLNRFRSDPQAFGKLCKDGHWQDVEIAVDWQMFDREIAALRPAQPLFFNPLLCKAARSHATYMVKAKEYGHHETKGEPGFLAEWPQDRAKAVGYRGRVSECSGAAQTCAFESIVGMVVDAERPGRGTGGMQDGRGHRVALIDPGSREVGIGFFPFARNRLSTGQLFGAADGVARIVGGVAIDDRDADAFYDIGEGLEGVHIRVASESYLTSASGSWRVDLATTKPQKLIASYGPLRVERIIEAGKQNVAVDLVFAIANELRTLSTQLEKVPAEQAAKRRQLQLERMQLLAAPEDSELQRAVQVMQQRVLDGIGIGTPSTAQVIAKELAGYRGTVQESWLRSAKLVDQLARKVTKATAIRNPKRQASALRKLVPLLRKAMADTTAPKLWRLLAATHDQAAPGN